MSNVDFKTAVKQEEEYLKRLYPTPEDIPGCLNLFETWTGCNGMFSRFIPYTLSEPVFSVAVRSQVKAVYRYGGRPRCSQKMDDFKFCLTLKALHPEEQREAWIRRRAEWWANRRLSKSSEDVWDIRECVSDILRSRSVC
jgi:hypothetical protein